MRFNTIVLANLAALVAGSTIPNDATLDERQSGNLGCLPAENGPYWEHVSRGLPRLGLNGPQICLSRPSSCEIVSTFGTAGFRVCGITDGTTASCFAAADLASYFRNIFLNCPNSEPGSIWSRVNGQYDLAPSELPSGTIFARVMLIDAETFPTPTPTPASSA